jgi:hypothetical protein
MDYYEKIIWTAILECGRGGNNVLRRHCQCGKCGYNVEAATAARYGLKCKVLYDWEDSIKTAALLGFV